MPLMKERLVLSPSGRGLQTASGAPFFWLGDTAWTIPNRLSLEEARHYFDVRVKQGYTVIQMVAVDPEGDPDLKNIHGDEAFLGGDPAKPNEAYFRHLDDILALAADMGLRILMLPVWGQLVTGDSWFGGTYEKIVHDGNAFELGQWMGKRYGRLPHVLWCLGGDRPPIHRGEDYRPVWRRMAEGLASGVLGKPLTWNEPDPGWQELLLTYHTNFQAEPLRYASSDWFPDEPWVSWHMLQSGHADGVASFEQVAVDYRRKPVKPVLDGEPNYEDMPDGYPDFGRLHDAWDVRKRAYWSLFAGSFGHTYGHASVWAMVREEETEAARPFTWKQALDRPAATQMGYVRNLMESRPFWRMAPNQAILSDSGISLEDHRQGCVDERGTCLMVYFTTGGDLVLDVSCLSGGRFHGWWFDPRTGTCCSQNGKQVDGPFAIWKKKNGELIHLRTPDGPHENDWVLVIDDAAAAYERPGAGGTTGGNAR